MSKYLLSILLYAELADNESKKAPNYPPHPPMPASRHSGVTIAEFDADMKICNLKEFQSKAEHYYPYGS